MTLQHYEQWIVVMRKVRDTTSRGVIVGYYKREADARREAKEINARKPDWNCWALLRQDY